MSQFIIKKVLTGVLLCSVCLFNFSAQRSLSSSLGYPVSRQECARQTQNLFKCTDKQYHDIHCNCLPCADARQHCSSEALPDDEFCQRLVELSYCGNTASTASVTTLSSTSSSAAPSSTRTDNWITKSTASAIQARMGAYQDSTDSTFNKPAKATIFIILAGIFLVLVISTLVALLYLGRKYREKLPRPIKSWRVFSRRQNRGESAATGSIELNNYGPPPVPPEPPRPAPIAVQQRPAGLVQTSLSWSETPDTAFTPDQYPISPGIPGVSEQQQQQQTIASELVEPLLPSHLRSARDAENARRKAAAASASDTD